MVFNRNVEQEFSQLVALDMSNTTKAKTPVLLSGMLHCLMFCLLNALLVLQDVTSFRDT